MIDGNSYLAEIFDKAFGVKSPVFIPYTYDLGDLFFKDKEPYKLPTETANTDKEPYKLPTQTANTIAGYTGVTVKSETKEEKYTWLGTPIVYPFTLKGGILKNYAPNGELQDFKLADFMLPAATLVDFSRAKIIAKTPVLGANGSVKELYSFDDWKIRVRGVCLDDSTRAVAKTAVEQKQELLKWEQVCGSIEVIGALFFEKNIKALTINSVNFQQLEAKPNIIPFEFECESDERLELIL